MVISLCLGILAAVLWLILLASPDFTSVGSNAATAIFFAITIIVAALVNLLAIKTGKRALVLVAAILYTIGIASIASAVISYINFARWKKSASIEGKE
jgi:hypothetical protein